MVDVVKEIEKNVEKGEKALKNAVEKIEDKIEKKDSEKKTSKNKSEKTTKKDTKKDFKKEAEKESLKTESTSSKDKKKELLEKVAKLKKKVSEKAVSTEELKEQVKVKKKKGMLVPLEEYVKAGIYLGTRVVTPDMKPFIYRRRADGLAIFNTDLIDEKLKEGAEYLSKFDSENIILVCKRQAGWKSAEKFSELTGIRVFTKKYPAGILTNTKLPDFFENQLTIITDHWLDKNALKDTLIVNKNVLMICDTNNFSKGADQIILGNNKSQKSLGLIFHVLAREYCKAKKPEVLDKIPELEWWTGEKEEKQEKKKAITAKVGAKYGV